MFEPKQKTGNNSRSSVWQVILKNQSCYGGSAYRTEEGIQYSRLVVTLEELARRQQLNTDQAKEKFQLTNREQSVIEHLAKGWTNKEIANALQITEQTVKEHIKHIMRKTNSTTRTGILVHIFNS